VEGGTAASEVSSSVSSGRRSADQKNAQQPETEVRSYVAAGKGRSEMAGEGREAAELDSIQRQASRDSIWDLYHAIWDMRFVTSCAEGREERRRIGAPDVCRRGVLVDRLQPVGAGGGRASRAGRCADLREGEGRF
jgi:hypothetical protein